MNENQPRPGLVGWFAWFVKLHEDRLRCVERDVPQSKRNLEEEHVNQYEIPGKVRPALVLHMSPDRRYLKVWYTCTSKQPNDPADDVSPHTKPKPPKRAFLRRDPAAIRLIPNTTAWCRGMPLPLDPTVFDKFTWQANEMEFGAPQAPTSVDAANKEPAN